MIGRSRIAVWLFIFILGLENTAFVVAGGKNEMENQTLFKIERSKDANEIWYIVNRNQKGNLNSEIPLKAFWIKKEGDNKIEPLTWVQNRYSYGIKMLDSENRDTNEWHFQFVSYPKIFKLKQAAGNQYRVFTSLGDKEIEVTRIYVQIDGGSFWIPTVSYVKVYGIELQTGSEITETIIP